MLEVVSYKSVAVFSIKAYHLMWKEYLNPLNSVQKAELSKNPKSHSSISKVKSQNVFPVKGINLVSAYIQAKSFFNYIAKSKQQ